MSLEDRDYWRKARREVYDQYGGDLSLHSKPVKSTPQKDTKQKDTEQKYYVTEVRKCPRCKRKNRIRILKVSRFASQRFEWKCANCGLKVKSWHTWAKVFWLCVCLAVAGLALYLVQIWNF